MGQECGRLPEIAYLLILYVRFKASSLHFAQVRRARTPATLGHHQTQVFQSSCECDITLSMTDSMIAMRQMITRLDDDLHEALKHKAKAEGKSLNAFVVDVLEGTVEREISGEQVLERLRAAGWLSDAPPPDGPTPTWEEVWEITRGSGSAVSDALQEMRDESW